MERQRRDILEAAARTFMKAGYASATMRAIAEEAGFTASSLYTYFESKEAIFNALLSTVAEDVMSVITEGVPKNLGFAERIELLLWRQLTLVEDNRELFAVMCSQGVLEADHTKELRRGALTYIGALAEWMREHGEGCLNGITPEDAAFFLWGIQQGTFLRWLGTPERPLRESVPLVQKLFLRGVS